MTHVVQTCITWSNTHEEKGAHRIVRPLDWNEAACHRQDSSNSARHHATNAGVLSDRKICLILLISVGIVKIRKVQKVIKSDAWYIPL